MKIQQPIFVADPVLKRLGFLSSDHARTIALKHGRIRSQVECDVEEQIERAKRERQASERRSV